MKLSELISRLNYLKENLGDSDIPEMFLKQINDYAVCKEEEYQENPNKELKDNINKLIEMSNGHISTDNELILDAEENVFFRLDDVTSVVELRCKILEWLSRPAHKLPRDIPRYKIKFIINEFLGTSFSGSELSVIYEYLGNCCNRDLTIKFIESDYNIETLKLKELV